MVRFMGDTPVKYFLIMSWYLTSTLIFLLRFLISSPVFHQIPAIEKILWSENKKILILLNKPKKNWKEFKEEIGLWGKKLKNDFMFRIFITFIMHYFFLIYIIYLPRNEMYEQRGNLCWENSLNSKWKYWYKLWFPH